MSLDLDLARMPQLTGFAAAQPGETWNFTTWYRDSAGGSGTTSFSDAVSLTLR